MVGEKVSNCLSSYYYYLKFKKMASWGLSYRVLKNLDLLPNEFLPKIHGGSMINHILSY